MMQQRKREKGERKPVRWRRSIDFTRSLCYDYFDHSSRCRNEYGAAPGSLFEAMIACLLLRKPWQDVQNPIIEFMSGTLVVIIILIDVGVMVGAWIIGGTVPSLMYYGLKLITPALVVPMAFLLCAVMSIFTGTSFGSIATMGIAVTGVAIGIGVPMPLVAGAVVAGAHVGGQNVSYVGQYKSVFWCNWRRSV